MWCDIYRKTDVRNWCYFDGKIVFGTCMWKRWVLAIGRFILLFIGDVSSCRVITIALKTISFLPI
jgi:hypothetical protein